MIIDIMEWVNKDPDSITYDEEKSLLTIRCKDGRIVPFRVSNDNKTLAIPQEYASALSVQLIEEYFCENLPSFIVEEMAGRSKLGLYNYSKKFKCETE